MALFKVSGSFSKGNMAEYILPVVLVGLVAVSGLAWLFQGDNGQQVLLRTLQGEDLAAGSSGEIALVSKQFGQNPNSQTLNLTLANGQTIQLKNVPVNAALSVEVDGVNGTTTKLLSALQQLITQLDREGEYPDSVNALKKMATAGYAFADTQKILEGIISGCGADKVCVQNQVFENEKLSLAFKSIARTSCSVRTYQACPDNTFRWVHRGFLKQCGTD